MEGYKAEEWSGEQIRKAFALQLRSDFYFQLIRSSPPPFVTMVATSLPVYCSDASLPGPDHKDKLSCLAGSFKRLGARVPLVKFDKMKDILLYARKHIFPQFRTFTSEEIPQTQDWINNINHPESRKAQLREVLSRTKEEGILQRPGMGDDDPKAAGAFTKDEKYTEEKPSRWINASKDEIKTSFGPYTDKCMERLCEHAAIIKTTPVAERASEIWRDLGGEGVIAQSSDATAMEDHYANFWMYDHPKVAAGDRPEILQNEPRYRIANDFMLYLGGHLMPTPDQIKTVKIIFGQSTQRHKDRALVNRLWNRIEDTPTLKAFFREIIDTYRRLEMKNFGYVLVNAILCSGEMNTSLKNTISMLVMANYAVYDLSKGKHTTVPTKNEGDDCLAVYPERYAPDEKWWFDNGWIVKIEFKGPVNEADFCGLIFDPEVQVSVPDIREVLAKFGWTNRRYVGASYKTRMALLRAKALSMACEYNDVPVLGPLAQRLLFLTRGINIRQSIIFNEELYHREKLQKYITMKPWQKPPNIDPRTRALVYKLQNISIDQQLEAERISSTILLDSPVSYPCLDFNTRWVHNMSRCHRTRVIPNYVNVPARKRLVAAMAAHLSLSLANGPGLSASKVAHMHEDLDLLSTGAI